MTRKAKKGGLVNVAPGNGRGRGPHNHAPRLERAITDLPQKVALVKAGVPVRIKEREYSFLAGVSTKKIQADRLKGIGIPAIVDDGMVFYDLGTVLRHIEATG